jgi:hypothetical protein
VNALELEHGCRAEYGPLVLRIQTTAQSKADWKVRRSRLPSKPANT